MTKTFRKLLEQAPATGGEAPPVFRITSTAVDRHRDRVLAIKAGGDELRVPLLWNHDSWKPAIGYARCFREAGQWVAEMHFDGACDTSKMVAAKVKAGSINTCSIRFVPAPEAEPVPNKEGGYDFPLVELLELSPVNIPANQEAVRLRSAEPVPEDEEKQYRSDGLAFRAEVRAALAELKAALAKALPDEKEPAAEEPPPAAAVPPEEEAKSLRAAVVKGWGFSAEQAAGLSLEDLRGYAALLRPAA